MPSVKKHIEDARSRVTGIVYYLQEMSSLDGARNPEAMSLAVRGIMCAAYELQHELRPLQVRLNLQITKAQAKQAKSSQKKGGR